MLIAGNWKMFKGPVGDRRASAGAARVDRRVERHRRRASARRTSRSQRARRARPSSGIAVYAQNVHWAESGAFTGEISAAMLRRARRRRRDRRPLRAAAATSARPTRRCRLRAEAALDAGLGVIACVGETRGRARRGRDRGRAAPPGGADRRRDRRSRAARDRLRARLGDRHRQDRHARAGAGGARLHPQPPRRRRSSTAARSSPTTPAS